MNNISTLHFALDRETKNKYVYKETGGQAVLETIYLKKLSDIGMSKPVELTVTITAKGKELAL